MQPRRWLVTGAAGFIGSNLVSELVRLGQTVIGVDNFATGQRKNLDEIVLDPAAGRLFTFMEGDITDLAFCHQSCNGVDVVLHQAGLGSVPRSIRDPLASNHANVVGSLNMLVAARDASVQRFVYAASSSTYGDHPALPKREDVIGRPLSPYAVSKYVNELYASVFFRTYGIATVGLRYFNVFGRRQDAHGAYAAVIPKWIGALLHNEPCTIFGDGETSRDFCYVANVVQANILAGTVVGEGIAGEVFNVAYGGRTTLNALYDIIVEELRRRGAALESPEPRRSDFREGDVRHSQADISKAALRLGYAPTHSVREGMAEAIDWYVRALTVDAAAVSSVS